MNLRILIAAFLSSIVLLGATSPGSAQQPTTTQWNEALSLTADLQMGGAGGADSEVPESLSDELSGAQYSVNGSVTFGTSGPPQVTCTVTGSYTSGLQTYLAGSAYARIDFQFRVHQTATPPVPVSTVPITVHTEATGEASGTMNSFGYASFELLSFTGPIVDYSISVGSYSPPASDSFNETYAMDAVPDQIYEGAMTANAGLGVEELQSSLAGTATTFIDPVIEIGDEVIVGTTSNYRDYFTIEFGSGYMLGSVPVQPATWGEIKSRYGR